MHLKWKQNSLKGVGFKIEFKSTENELDMPKWNAPFLHNKCPLERATYHSNDKYLLSTCCVPALC